MRYDIYLFDADDTLFDFGRAEENALMRMFDRYNFIYSDQIRRIYRSISEILWDQFERREIDKNQLQYQRFAQLFQAINVDCDAAAFNGEYLVELGRGAFLLDGAYCVCKTLHEHNRQIYIVTNGISVTQKLRLGCSDIKAFVSDIFVSEDVGFQKPQTQYFDYIFSHIDAADKRMIIIGDSLTADIQGGRNAGIDTCWYNPAKKDNTVGVAPTYEISDLREVLSL